MSVNYTDFDKIWASTSPLTPYEFSESQYKEGWNFVGNTPPSRQMWDKFMQQADEKMQYLYNHESVPVGHEYFTFNPNIPQGSLPLFGGEYSRETYSALWNWVQQQTGYLKTEAEWQQIYTTNAGNVPYYSDGDGSTTFRVPSLKCWVKGANGTVSEVGSYLAAGLPNIIGSFSSDAFGGNAVGIRAANGAFLTDGTVSAIYKAQTDGTTSQPTYACFDASKSNSIYGNSTTVQPPSIVGMWLVKAYGVVEDTGSIDEQQYIDDRFNASKQYTDDKIAPIGNIVADSISSSVTGNASQEKTICNITLAKGVWVVTGHIKFTGTVSQRLYGASVSKTANSVSSANDGSMIVQASVANNLSLEVVRIVNMANDGTYYLNAYSEYSYTVTNADINAVRII